MIDDHCVSRHEGSSIHLGIDSSFVVVIVLVFANLPNWMGKWESDYYRLESNLYIIDLYQFKIAFYDIHYLVCRCSYFYEYAKNNLEKRPSPNTLLVSIKKTNNTQ